MNERTLDLLTGIKDHIDDFSDALQGGSISEAQKALQNATDSIADLSKLMAETLASYEIAKRAANATPDDLEAATGTLRAELSVAIALSKSLSDELFLHGNAAQQRRIVQDIDSAVSRASIRTRALSEAVNK